ncbi:hypothetical protein V2A60_005737 [Cordyceps javanica]
MDPSNYNSWTKLGLVERVRQLEAELQTRPAAPEPDVAVGQHGNGEAAPAPGTTKPKIKRKMDPSKYSTRFIALKLAYLGKNYGGFEFQAVGNQPTIEEELWNALTKACLIFPQDEKIVDFNICEYSKCGRTDRGVSAFGQVIGIRVRSNRPLPKKPKRPVEEGTTEEQVVQAEGPEAEEKPFDPIADEIPYPMVLNRLLPPDIRILAWCPSPPPDFSARFSCRERQYRYFFTQPAFSPEPSTGGEGKPGWLDIDAMRDAAKRFEGEQDFRNLCKVDPAKLITNWSRTIFESDIVEVRDAATALPYVTAAGFSPASVAGTAAGEFPKVYYFHVRGSAFLWHQIRHMVAVLFLVGQGLEKPSVVSELLDVNRYPRKPGYAMADEVPLVLWDCVFPDLAAADATPLSAHNTHVDTMQWIRAGAETSSSMRAGQFGPFGALDGMWKLWRGHKMDELLSGQLLQLMAEQATGGDEVRTQQQQQQPEKPQSNKKSALSVRLYEGGNTGRPAGKYVPMERKDKLESPDELNDKYARRKGFKDAADMRARRNESKDAVMQDDE